MTRMGADVWDLLSVKLLLDDGRPPGYAGEVPEFDSSGSE